METQLKLIPASEHPTALESQWLNAISQSLKSWMMSFLQ